MDDFRHFREIGSPESFLAPMVAHSELAFRVLCRKYGVACCYTQMIHTSYFLQMKKSRNNIFQTRKSDRPLIAQLAGKDPHDMLECAKLLQDDVDFIDVNLGCPQRIAIRGGYGVALMDNWELTTDIVSTLSKNLSKPVSCKIRIFASVLDTIAYAKCLVASGCKMLVVHGRPNTLKAYTGTFCDWDIIGRVRRAIPEIPVIGNGGILTRTDALRVMEETGVDGVMSGDGLLKNPMLFSGKDSLSELESVEMAREYLGIAVEYGASNKEIKCHMWKFLLVILRSNVDVRVKIRNSSSPADYYAVLDLLEERINNGIVVTEVGDVNSLTQKKRKFKQGSEGGDPVLGSKSKADT